MKCNTVGTLMQIYIRIYNLLLDYKWEKNKGSVSFCKASSV